MQIQDGTPSVHNKYGSRATVCVLLCPELTHVAVAILTMHFTCSPRRYGGWRECRQNSPCFDVDRGKRREKRKRERWRWKRKTSKNLLPSTLDLYVRSSTLLTDLVFLFLWNSRGGLLCGTIKPLRIRRDIKDRQRVVSKRDKRQQDMAAIMVSNTSVIFSYLITFYLRPRLSNIILPYFLTVWKPEYWSLFCGAVK
jgi:hypothetical protein